MSYNVEGPRVNDIVPEFPWIRAKITLTKTLHKKSFLPYVKLDLVMVLVQNFPQRFTH